MSDDHMPDLRHARNWLDEIRTDLLAARERARLALDGDHDVTEELIEFARLAETHAATLGDIIARGEVVPQAWAEAARELARYSSESEARDYTEQDEEGRRGHIYHAIHRILCLPPADDALAAVERGRAAFGVEHEDALPTPAQFEAMRRRMRKDVSATVFIEPFDLPPGYVLVRYSDGFECGISRTGDVSS